VTAAESLAAFVRGFPAMSRQTDLTITRAGPAPATHFMHCGGGAIFTWFPPVAGVGKIPPVHPS